MNISIIGGDLRIARLAQICSKEGKNVYTYGLEDFFKTVVEDKIILCKSLEEALEKSNLIISGMPFSKDNVYVNSPFTHEKIAIQELKNNLDGKTFIAGGIPKEFYNEDIKNIDLLDNEKLTILNAIATVEGTIKIVIDEREETIFESNVLICGFGRIGKILCNRFKALGAKVYCSARKEKDLTWIRENGCIPINYKELTYLGKYFDIVINTVPIMIIGKKELNSFKENVLIVDVASKPGGVDKDYADKIGIKAIHELGIPGKELPTSAAKYIKEVIDIFLNRRMDAEWFYCNLVEKIAESYDNEKLEIPNVTLNAYCFYGTCDNYVTKIDEFISEYTTI